MRLAFVTPSPLPYHTPIFNELDRMLELHVLYLDREERVNRFRDAWGEEPRFAHSFHAGRTVVLDRLDLRVRLSVGASRRLDELDPDAVGVLSWNTGALEPFLWAKLRRRPVVMWAESTDFSGVFRGPLSTRVRRAIAARTDAFVSNGSCASAYLRRLGVDPARVVTSRLAARTRGAAPEHAEPRAGGPHFLFVGRLTPRKHALDLARCFGAVLRMHPDATLTIAGDGALRGEIERCAAAYGSRASVHGHVEGPELARLYRRSDVLVLPAEREVWGLVVNEALAHGLFVVATEEVGSAHDLVNDESGIVVPAPADAAALADALARAASRCDRSAEARARRASSVRAYTPERFARDLYTAIRLAAR